MPVRLADGSAGDADYGAIGQGYSRYRRLDPRIAALINRFLGDAAKIHPVLVVLALIIGEHYYGFSGALLAVPIMSVLVTIFKAARARAMELDAEVVADEVAGLGHLDQEARRRRLQTHDGG